MNPRRIVAALLVLFVSVPSLASCDPEDVRDVKEGVNDIEREVNEGADELEQQIDEADNDGKDD